jgi:hypothetical protein
MCAKKVRVVPVFSRKRPAWQCGSKENSPHRTLARRRWSHRLSVVKDIAVGAGKAQGLEDLYRIYTRTQQDGLNYNLAYIGADFTVVHRKDFDTDYMRAMFDYSYPLAARPGLIAIKINTRVDHALFSLSTFD